MTAGVATVDQRHRAIVAAGDHQVGPAVPIEIGHGDAVITALSFVAVLLASINVFGGFAVTRRMRRIPSRKSWPCT